MNLLNWERIKFRLKEKIKRCRFIRHITGFIYKVLRKIVPYKKRIPYEKYFSKNYYVKDQEEYIVSCNGGGLSNRLKCLISSMRLADKFSKILILHWPKNSACNCKFSDLFENKITEIDSEEMQVIINSKNKKYKLINTWRLIPLPEDKLPNNFSRAFPSKTGRNIDLEYGRIPTSIRESFLIYIRRLVLNRYISEEVKNFLQRFNNCTLSINFRTWPEDGYENRRIFFCMKNIFKIIDKMKNNNFFVVCDSPEFMKNVIIKYKERVIYYPKRTFQGDRNSVEGIQDALIDLMLLSNSRILFLDFFSTYSEMSWWFGGCKAKVIIIPPKTYFFRRFKIEPQITGYSLFWKLHWYDLID